MPKQPHQQGVSEGSSGAPNGPRPSYALNARQQDSPTQNMTPITQPGHYASSTSSTPVAAASASASASGATANQGTLGHLPPRNAYGAAPLSNYRESNLVSNIQNGVSLKSEIRGGEQSTSSSQLPEITQRVPPIQPRPLSRTSQSENNKSTPDTTFPPPQMYQQPPSMTTYGLQQLHPIQKLQRLHQAKSSSSTVTSMSTGYQQQSPKQFKNSNKQANSDPARAKEDEGEAKPRMRVVKACDRCRAHKIKCSGEQPCATCSKQKKECIYSVRPPAAKRPAGKKDELPYHELKRPKVYEPFGLPRVEKSDENEYVKHLENRVHYLESLLTNNSVHTFKPPSSTEPEGEYIDETLYATSSKWRFSRRHQNLLIVELCKSMYSNLSEELKKLVTVPRTQYFGWNLSGVSYVGGEDLPVLPEINSYNLDEESLIKYFFEDINPMFSIIHEVVFKKQLAAYDNLLGEAVASLTKDERDSKANQTSLFSAILYLIFALSIRFREMLKPKNPDINLLKLETKLFKYGYKVVSVLSFEWESFELIQAWLLIALYLRVTHRQTSCSHALGEAVVMVKSMGLGYSDENPKIFNSTPYEKLKARRIFWATFSMDRTFGLQLGRYTGIREEDFTISYPSMNFALESTNDLWLSIEALAMIHIARISNFVHTFPNDNPHYVKYQQVNSELVTLNEWLNNNGFRNDLLFNKNKYDANSIIRAQVKLNYYDLVLCVHSKVLFNYVGRRIASHGLKVEMVVDACNGIVEVLDKTNKAGALYTPWYSVLMLLFNIGVNAITLINSGVMINQARDILKNSIRLLTILRKSPIRDDQNKLVFRERFKMVRECMWALKMANRMLSLRLKEDIGVLNGIGVDHGSSDVNKQHFTQLGAVVENEVPEEDFEFSSTQPNDVFETQIRRSTDKSILQDASIEDSPASLISDPMPLNSADPVDNYSSVEIENMLGNLQWFDQWIDFNLDF